MGWVKNVGPLALATTSENNSLIGSNVLCEIIYTGATNHILYIAAGSKITASTHSEIIDVNGNTITRFTANGTGVERIQINGLTPGTYISLQEVSGTSDTAPVLNYISGKS